MWLSLALTVFIGALVSGAPAQSDTQKGLTQLRQAFQAAFERSITNGNWNYHFGDLEPYFYFSESATSIDSMYPIVSQSEAVGALEDVLNSGRVKSGWITDTYRVAANGDVLLDTRSGVATGAYPQLEADMLNTLSNHFGVTITAEDYFFDSSPEAMAALVSHQVHVLPLMGVVGGTYEDIARSYSCLPGVALTYAAPSYIYLRNDLAETITTPELLIDAMAGTNPPKIAAVGGGICDTCTSVLGSDCELYYDRDQAYADVLSDDVQGIWYMPPVSQTEKDAVESIGFLSNRCITSLFPLEQDEVSVYEDDLPDEYNTVNDCVGTMQFREAWEAAFVRTVENGEWDSIWGTEAAYTLSESVAPDTDLYPFPTLSSVVGRMSDIINRGTIRSCATHHHWTTPSGQTLEDTEGSVGTGLRYNHEDDICDQISSWCGVTIHMEETLVDSAAECLTMLYNDEVDILSELWPLAGSYDGEAYEYTFRPGTIHTMSTFSYLYALDSSNFDDVDTFMQMVANNPAAYPIGVLGAGTQTTCEGIFDTNYVTLYTSTDDLYDSLSDGDIVAVFATAPPTDVVNVENLGIVSSRALGSIFQSESCTAYTVLYSDDDSAAHCVLANLALLLALLAICVV